MTGDAKEAVKPKDDDDFVRECRKRQAGYPEGHGERHKIDAMIERYQKSHTREE